MPILINTPRIEQAIFAEASATDDAIEYYAVIWKVPNLASSLVYYFFDTAKHGEGSSAIWHHLNVEQ